MVAAWVLACLIVGMASASSADQADGFPGEPTRDYRANAGQLTRYWCSEIWATRGWAAEPGATALPADGTLNRGQAPSAQGLARIQTYWQAQEAGQSARIQLAHTNATTRLADWSTLKTRHASVLERIASIEAKVTRWGPELARHDDALGAILPAMGLLQGYASAKSRLDAAYARASALTNLSSRDPQTGMRAPEILAEQTRIDGAIRELRGQLIAADLVDAGATTPETLIAGLQSANRFHEQERTALLRQSGLNGEEAAELLQLRAELESLRAPLQSAADRAERALLELNQRELEQRHFLLNHALIGACLADQARHLGTPTPTGPPEVTLPGGETVTDLAHTITGTYKQVCEIPSHPNPADRRIPYPVGSMVLEFLDGNRFRVQLTAPSITGNPAHADRIVAEGDWDPLTGQGRGVGDLERLAPEALRTRLVRVSIFVQNRNGQTLVQGLYCDGPDPARMDEIVAALGGSTYLGYCGGKFWGPEGNLEPSGAERDTQCGF